MAQIDLKYATILFRDGYAGATGAQVGAVNNALGYAQGATTMTVDGFTAEVTVGDAFTVAGSSVNGVLTRHVISAQTPTASATTSITFSPALSAAVLDNAVITIQPHQIEVKIGEGNLTYTERRNMEYVRDRGRLSTVREGDQEPVDVSIDAIWEYITADTDEVPTIEDALKKRGNASNWVSTSSDPCEPYAIDIVVLYEPPCETQDNEQITLPDFRYEEIAHDLRAGTFSISGKSNVTQAVPVRA